MPCYLLYSGALTLTSPRSSQLMLEAANWAPTHGKTEPWRFVVLDRAAAIDLVDKSIEVHSTALERIVKA